MKLRIRELRKNLHISQSDFSERVGVSLRTVGAWERGETVPDAEQIWDCAVALECTPNDVLGWPESAQGAGGLNDKFEGELLSCYRASTVERKSGILQVARDSAAMSKDAAKSGVSTADELSA